MRSLIGMVLLGWPLAAQLPPTQPSAPGEQAPVFRVETGLALVRFHVVDKGKYVDTLRAEDVRLLEDGVPQKIALFDGPSSEPGGARTVPVEIILLFDVSLSVMQPNLLDSFSIKETFLDGLGEHVGISMYAFGARLKRFCRPTRDLEKLRQALEAVYRFEHAGTRLYESVVTVAGDLSASEAGATRLMLVFSDGFETGKGKPEDAIEAANAHGVPLYPIVLGHGRLLQQAARAGAMDPLARGGRGRNSAQQAADMERVARLRENESRMAEFAAMGPRTGGRSFDLPVLNSLVLRNVFTSLVQQVRAEYVVGYYPHPAAAAKRPHRVQVKLRPGVKGKVMGGARTVVH